MKVKRKLQDSGETRIVLQDESDGNETGVGDKDAIELMMKDDNAMRRKNWKGAIRTGDPAFS